MLDGLKRAREIIETEIHCQMVEDDAEFIIRGLRTVLKYVNAEIRNENVEIRNIENGQ